MQFSNKMFATCADVIFVADIALLSLVYLSVMLRTNWLQALVLRSGTKISMATSSKGPAGANNYNFL